MKHLITDIQRFSLSDGPGIRTTVFFKGCNMRCVWCHNPETLSFTEDLMFYPEKCIGCGKCFGACPTGAQKIVDGKHVIDRALCTKCGKCTEVCYAEALAMSGREMTVEEIMLEVRRDKAYYEASGGGVTLSGGEVLCHVDFAAELAKACREEGISVAIETNLSLPYEKIKPLLDRVDVIMADLKLFDDEAHKKYTGVSNAQVLENLMRITDIPLIVRTPLIPNVTATPENLRAIAKTLVGKKNLVYYQLLNFNPLGASKYRGLDMGNDFGGARPYTDAEMRALPMCVGEIPSTATFHVTVPAGEVFSLAADEAHYNIFILIEGECTMESDGKTYDFAKRVTFVPAPEKDMTITAATNVQMVQIAWDITEEDVKLRADYGTEFPLVQPYATGIQYVDPNKSPKTISRMMIPHKIIPRFAIGSVESYGYDYVKPHSHPMLDQYFFSFPENNMSLIINGEHIPMGGNMMVHIPLGADHGVEVTGTDHLHYMWIDFLPDNEAGLKRLDERHKPTGTVRDLEKEDKFRDNDK